jgi:hypothetical protein
MCLYLPTVQKTEERESKVHEFINRYKQSKNSERSLKLSSSSLALQPGVSFNLLHDTPQSEAHLNVS